VLAQSLERARSSIFILGWDLDARLVLDQEGDGLASLSLIELLRRRLLETLGLEIRILLWDRSIFYGGNRKSRKALRRARLDQSRLHYHYEAAPLGASHHTKLVCIDDEVAFIGGIDLTGNRWDPEDHPASHPHRITPDGKTYGPIHDLQMLVEGPAARALSELARARWSRATGESLPPPIAASSRMAWPPAVKAEFQNLCVGIARTDPYAARGGIQEVEALNHVALAHARHSIYIEAQYLTSEAVGEILAERLREPNGPEIVIIVTRVSRGIVEQFAMGGNRDRLLRRLSAADRWGRLRTYYPAVRDGAMRVDMKIHAKLIIVDDCFLRVGSSNLNNRSMSVDTECDIAMEASDPSHRRLIAASRNRLLAEQLHCTVSAVADALRTRKSLIRTIETLNSEGFLRPLPVTQADGSDEPLPGTAILDPKQPIVAETLWARITRALGAAPGDPAPQLCHPKQGEAGRKGQQEVDAAERDQRANRLRVRQ
jgi:phosphatidylserine/phosphatidylglycerophosphate/cardiolipin synthase-like enzyme